MIKHTKDERRSPYTNTLKNESKSLLFGVMHICPTRRSNICTRQDLFPPKHLNTHFPGQLKRQMCRFLHTNTTDPTCLCVCGVPRARCGKVKHPLISSAAEVRQTRTINGCVLTPHTRVTLSPSSCKHQGAGSRNRCRSPERYLAQRHLGSCYKE